MFGGRSLKREKNGRIKANTMLDTHGDFLSHRNVSSKYEEKIYKFPRIDRCEKEVNNGAIEHIDFSRFSAFEERQRVCREKGNSFI